ncbi:MAG: hypothetical protein J6B85_09875 [Lachnospiraceae bacterium]|nr:hypothetical protein [Lachnospiraceae bacterium]
MKNGKRIAAIAGIAVLVLMYLLTLIAAITAKPYANGLFMASAVCTVIIPILLYGFIVIYKLVHKEDDENTMSLREFRKKKKELEKELQGENKKN